MALVISLLTFSYFCLAISLVGIGIIVYQKIPTLLKLPPQAEGPVQSISLNGRASALIKKISISPRYRLVFLGFAEKLLRRIRILFLKLDSFCAALIAKSREKSHDWAVKSKSWVSEGRMKKIEKLKLMASLRTTPEQKEENLLRSLRQNPKDIKAYKELGALYLEQRNFQDAKAAFEEVLKINSEDELAKEKLEEINRVDNGNTIETNRNL